MMTNNPRSVRRASALLVCLIGLFTANLSFAAATRKFYDISAGEALATLKQFIAQSGEQLLYSTDAVEGVTTNAVKGTYTAPEVLGQMVNGTSLAVVTDKKNGALSLVRASDPNGPRAAPTTANSARPERTEKNGPITTEETVVLSPFEVTAAGNRGYYGANTMSGTRLNSKIEDIAASLTVVTKEQMSDFAMLDVHDIFAYEASTEGKGTYTDFEFDISNQPVDRTTLDPNNANRVRGIGPANISVGNYETSKRVPLDPISIDSVEISRGPNANVFGLGDAAGTVNTVPSRANLQRNKSQVGLRTDSIDGWRTSLDLNRVIKKDVLAVRGSGVKQRDGYNLKPSGTDTSLLNGMATFRPFKTTTLRASYSRYHIEGNRPNSTPPRDTISGWLSQGKPTWLPQGNRAGGGGYIKLNGVTYGPNGVISATNTAGYNQTATSPAYLTGPNAMVGGLAFAPFTIHRPVSVLFVDGDGSVGYWSRVQANASTTDPIPNAQQIILVQPNPLTPRSPFVSSAASPIPAQPLFAGDPLVTDKAVYDWSSINTSAVNRLRETVKTSNVELEQTIFHTPRQSLAVNLGYFREDAARWRRDILGQTSSGSGTGGTLAIDVNETRLDGSPNPYFLRPYMTNFQPTTRETPLFWETVRAQVAYKLDLAVEKNALRWLGTHYLNGFDDYKNRESRSYAQRDVVVDSHTWLPAGTPRSASVNGAARQYLRYYVGDATGSNVDYAPKDYVPGTYNLHWGSGIPGIGRAFGPEAATIDLADTTDNSAAGDQTRTIVKTEGASLQSFFLNERVVTTVGLRRDTTYDRLGVAMTYLPDGLHRDMAAFNRWAPGDWVRNSGMTKTAGVVVRPLPRSWSDMLRIHANVADSFRPAEIAHDLHLNVLPNPHGKGHDYGITVKLLGDRFTARINRYDTKQLQSRLSAVSTIATRFRNLDFYSDGFFGTVGSGNSMALIDLAYRSVTGARTTSDAPLALTDAQLARVSAITGLDAQYITADRSSTFRNQTKETADVRSTGYEIELHYTPSNFWTLKLTASEAKVTDANLSPGLAQWIQERLPVWTTVIDPIAGSRWWNTPHVDIPGLGTPESYFKSALLKPAYDVLVANSGKPRTQTRKYSFRLSTKYRLAGITDSKLLKNLAVGGALRWEDKGGIGFYGRQDDPSLPMLYTSLDPNRPIYDKARLYADAFVSFHARLFSNKVASTFQLNVRNLQEERARLQPFAVWPDGRPSAFRIVDPRLFILTATFDL